MSLPSDLSCSSGIQDTPLGKSMGMCCVSSELDGDSTPLMCRHVCSDMEMSCCVPSSPWCSFTCCPHRSPFLWEVLSAFPTVKAPLLLFLGEWYLILLLLKDFYLHYICVLCLIQCFFNHCIRILS